MEMRFRIRWPRASTISTVGESEHHVHRIGRNTEIFRSTTSFLMRNAISSSRSRGAMPAVRLVHQQEARLVGERNGKFDAFDIARTKLATGPLGRLAHPDLFKQAEGTVTRHLGGATTGRSRARAYTMPSAHSR